MTAADGCRNRTQLPNYSTSFRAGFESAGRQPSRREISSATLMTLRAISASRLGLTR
jgi:hypothetical protein